MKRIILSGGGTGGHIYPAVSVAEALRRRLGDDVEILFVGAEGKYDSFHKKYTTRKYPQK